MSFFVFDIETLGIESTSIVLSAALLHVPIDTPRDNDLAYQYLVDRARFVKFKVDEQKALGRATTPSTLDWWRKQGVVQQRINILPASHDVSVVEGCRVLKEYHRSFIDAVNIPVWTRGALDQILFESLLRTFDIDDFIRYNVYRDVRTAVDIIYPATSKSGYVDIPNFNRDAVVKHDPRHDCALDALMMMRGKQ